MKTFNEMLEGDVKHFAEVFFVTGFERVRVSGENGREGTILTIFTVPTAIYIHMANVLTVSCFGQKCTM